MGLNIDILVLFSHFKLLCNKNINLFLAKVVGNLRNPQNTTIRKNIANFNVKRNQFSQIEKSRKHF